MIFLRTPWEKLEELLVRRSPYPTRFAKLCLEHQNVPIQDRNIHECKNCEQDLRKFAFFCAKANSFMAQWIQDTKALLVTAEKVKS